MARPDLRDERRTQILDTAALVFARHGFNQARMDDIVDASGLSKGTIYWYFKSKDALIIELVRRFFDRELHEWQALLTEQTPVCERLVRLSRLLADDLEQNRHLLPLIYEFYALATRQETVRQILQSYLQSYRALIVSLLEQGIERGEFRPVDPVKTATTITALYEGLIIVEMADAQAIRFQELSESSLQLLIDGLRR
jgi:AcrR family transcriptional regulator